MDIKHTFLLVTYNHEKTISRAIDSIVKKQTIPFEVIIFDDCSQDSTSSIVQKYVDLYPFIKHIRNEENLGLYKNINNMFSAEVKGDVVSLLAGDDCIEGDMLDSFNKIIYENKLSGQNEKFLITPNTKLIHSENNSEEILDNYIVRNKNQFKLKVKLKTYGRFTGISKKLFEDFGRLDSSFGIWSDQLHSVDVYNKCDKFYFVDFPHNVYFRNECSISVKTNQKEISQSLIKVCDEILNRYQNELNLLDVIYVKKIIYSNKLNSQKNLVNVLIFIFFNILSFGQDDSKTWAKSFSPLLSRRIKNILKGNF